MSTTSRLFGAPSPSTRRLGAGLLAAVLLYAPGCAPAPRWQRPAVALVLIDTLRPDRVGLPGTGHASTPYLASLAARSTLFERAYSTSSWTAPATASVFTGLYPTHHGVTQGLFANRTAIRALEGSGAARIELNRLPADVASLPEIFRRAGYRTFAVGTNPNLAAPIGFARGFDHTAFADEEDASWIVGIVREWREQLLGGEQPYLLYLHFNDPHRPYRAHAPWYRASENPVARQISAYDSEISYLDEQLRTIHEMLGWDDGVVLAIVSDHGEELWERGGNGHGFSLHGELTDVLMLLHGPGIPARRVRAPASLIDLLPTLAELAGLEAPAGRDGLSLVPLLAASRAAEDARSERLVFAHRSALSPLGTLELWSATDGRWKLIRGPSGDALFDLAADPAERVDVSASRRAVASRLAAALETLRAGRRASPASVSVELDASLRETLERLGYVETEAAEANPAPLD